MNSQKLEDFLSNIKINIILKDPFIGNSLTNIDIQENTTIQTLCAFFNTNTLKFNINYNYHFLLSLKNLNEVVAVFKHEVLHILNNHFSRAEEWEKKNNQSINMHYANIAMDIAINQYIDNIPSLALKPEDYGLPRNLDFETYYKMLTDKIHKNKKKKNDINNKIKQLKEENKNSLSKKQTQENLKEIKDLNEIMKNINIEERKEKIEKNKNKLTEEERKEVFEKLQELSEKINDNPKNNSLKEEYNKELNKLENDDHSNFNNEEFFEDEINKSLVENITKNILNESYKRSKERGSIPDYIENLKESWKKEEPVLDWKKLTKQFLEKTSISNEKEETWYKPNRRFKNVKGKRKIKELEVLVAVDTSGSISKKTIISFIGEIMRIDKNLNPTIVYFHSRIYNIMKDSDIKKKKNYENIKRGGTDFQPIFDFAKKEKLKRVVMMTDGYGEEEVNSYNIKSLWIDEKISKTTIIKKRKIKGFDIFYNYKTTKVK